MNKKPKFKNKMIWLLKHSLVIIILIFSIIDYTCKMCNCPLNYYQKNDPQMLLTLIPLAITVVSISLTLTSDKIENVSIFEFRNFRSKFYFTFQEMMIITLSLFILYFILIHFEIYISILLIEISSIIYSILFIIQELPLLERNDKYITKVIKYAYFNKESKTLNLYIDKKSNNSLSIALTSFLLRNGLKNSFKKFKTSDNSKNKEILKDFMDINTNNLINLVYYSKTKVFDRSINVENIINMSFSNIKDILTFSKDFDLIKIHEDNKHTSISFVSNALINLYTLCDYFGFNELFKNEFNVLFIAFNFKKKNGQEYEIYLDKIFNQIILQTVLNKKYWIINSLINYQKENSLYEEEIFFFIFYMSIIFKNNVNGLFQAILSFNFNPKKITSSDKVIKNIFSTLLKKYTNKYNFKIIFDFIPRFLEYIEFGVNDILIIDEIKKTLLDSVFEYIFYFDNNNYFKNDDVEECINKLSDNNKKIFYKTIKENWLINSKFNYARGQNNFCDFFNINKNPRMISPNDEAIDIFKEIIFQIKP